MFEAVGPMKVVDAGMGVPSLRIVKGGRCQREPQFSSSPGDRGAGTVGKGPCVPHVQVIQDAMDL